MLTTLAQQTDSATAQYFGSIGGIIVATITLVAILRKTLKDVPAAKAVPIWIYAVGIAAGLTALARYGLETLDGPILDLILQAVIAAGAASGFREWIKDVRVSPSTARSLGLGVCCVLILGGCSYDPGAEAHLRAAEGYHETIGTQVSDYVDSLPEDTPTDAMIKQSILEAHEAFGEANAARRKDLYASPLLGE